MTYTLRYRCDECGRTTVNLCHDGTRSCYVDTGTASSLRDWDALTEFKEET